MGHVRLAGWGQGTHVARRLTQADQVLRPVLNKVCRWEMGVTEKVSGSRHDIYIKVGLMGTINPG